MARRYTDRHQEDAAEIAAEVVRRGKSTGWAGDTKVVAALETALAPFNIGYTDDLHGTWAHVDGGTSFARRPS